MRTASCLLLLALAGCSLTSRTRGAPAGDAELLPAGTLNTERNEYNPSLAPDGRTLVFARADADFRHARILVSRWRDGAWSAPEPVPFADDRWSDSDPTFAPDGRTLYFVSTRPAPGRDSARRDLDVWRVAVARDGWGTPEHLGAVNSRGEELGPTWHDGALYFASTRGGRARMLDIFRAPAAGAGFGAPEPVAAWNTPQSESDVEFSPDGRTVLFWSDRPGGQGAADVRASRRTADGGWAPATPLGGGVNSAGFDFTPSFTRDGRWLWFASMRRDSTAGVAVLNGQGNLYRVRARAALP